MGHPRRHFKHQSVYLATNRLAEGLPLVPNDFVNSLLFGVIADASQRYHSVKICSFSILQNHYHLIFVPVGNPADVSAFMGYVDGEIAKLICKLLGKRNCKIWAQRPHIANLATAEDVMRKTAYVFVNPVAANFCDTAEKWIGVSSYHTLFENERRAYKRIYPSNVRKLPNAAFSRQLSSRLMRDLSKMEFNECELSVDPFAWKFCFEDTKDVDDAQLKGILLERVKLEEARYRKMRKSALLDTDKLATQNPYKHYRPEKMGRRVYCICCNPELRLQLIAEYKEFCAKCAHVWHEWKSGNLEVTYPAGAFIPARAPMANILCLHS